MSKNGGGHSWDNYVSSQNCYRKHKIGTLQKKSYDPELIDHILTEVFGVDWRRAWPNNDG